MTASKLQPIRFNRRQVALMVAVAILYDVDSLQDDTGHTRRELRAIAAQKMEPSRAMLDFFRLKRSRAAYIWDPRLEWKNNPCWGPPMRRPSVEIVDAGQAIHLAVRTIEQSFPSGRPRFVR